MTTKSLLESFEILLCLGIIISGVAGFIQYMRNAYQKGPLTIYQFSCYSFLTVFFAFQAAKYAQQENEPQFLIMVGSSSIGLFSIIFAYRRIYNAKNKAEQIGSPNGSPLGSLKKVDHD